VDGIHDMGGLHGFGPVPREQEDAPFHFGWERRVVGIEVALEALDMWNTDQHRHAIERIEPARYLADSYYERWLDGMETLLDETGLVSREDLAARVERVRSGETSRPAREDPELRARIDRVVDHGGTKRRDSDAPPRFAVGDRVRARDLHVEGHTRLPRYARRRAGTVVADYGVYAFADALAAGEGEAPERMYCVAFDAQELWGETAEPGCTVRLDLFEPYLEPA
jgi:nitrile hydratase